MELPTGKKVTLFSSLPLESSLKKKKKEKNFEVILIPIPLYVTWPILGILALKAYGILSSPSLAFSPLSWY